MNSRLILLIVSLLQVTEGIEVDLYAPSFPKIMEYFKTKEKYIEWSLSINFLGFFLSGLVSSFISDNYGRRKIVIFGCYTFLVATILCIFSPNIWFFIFCRFLQGISISAAAMVSYAMITDIYHGAQRLRIMTMLNSLITLSIAAAPIFGTYLAVSYGWQSNFVVITIFAVLSCLGVHYLPETLEVTNNKSFQIKQLFKDYYRLATNREMFQIIFSICFLLTPYWIFIGTSSLLFMNELNVSPEQYGYYQGFVAMSYGVLSLLSSYYITRINYNSGLRVSVIVALIAASLLFIDSIMFKDNAFVITCLIVILSISMVLPVNLLYARVYEMIPEMRATAGALAWSARVFVSSIFMSIVGVVYNGTLFPIAACILLCIAVAFPVVFRLTKYEVR
jgi:DHA1 family bicyclomycin/chloramphenicol resistance-like MFS transporter